MFLVIPWCALVDSLYFVTLVSVKMGWAKCMCTCVLIVLVTPLRKVTNDRKYIQRFQYKVFS